MASSLIASLFLVSVVFCQFVSAADPVAVKAKAGTDVTLPCKAAGGQAVVQAEWSRPDQASAPVLLYKNKKVDDNQLVAYKGRSSLVDAEKGDLSLVLKKVVGKDTGKYECRAELGGGAAGGGGATGGGGTGGGGTGGEGGTGGTGTGGEGGTGEASGLTGGKGGSSRHSGTILKSEPISIVVLTVEGGSSHGGDGLKPNTVLPVGLLALLALVAALQ
ncbi:PE-PGRS family protein PE_PGRS5-like [Gambusia affinis]|uniref:PE-PGRS family protein PE_PGRS5-like n=1 Tax=Gambusia affinis TaxID=33528 RepID=UPI001CDC3DEC|nr:PE-PGRS family protein PE_PGRS5-like [Gambusia affinis]